MQDKVVVITGASGGIGAALAELLAARGASVALVARREAPLAAVAARCGWRALAIVADVTDRQEVRRVVEESIARFGRIDVWVNNVGQGITRLPSQLTDDDIDDIMRINVKSALYGMQEVLPHFQSRGAGHVINVSSMLGRIPFAVFRSAYNGAKHFLNALTANFRSEVQQKHPGIQYSLVSPGVVRTDFGLNARHGGLDSRQLPGSQSAEEVAAVIAGVIESRQPDVYTRAGARELVVGYFASLGEDDGAGRDGLLRASRDWAATAGGGDVEKTVSFWSEDAVVLPPDKPAVVGTEAIRGFVRASGAVPGFSITWEPERAAIAASGDVGYLIERNRVTFDDSAGALQTQYGKAVTIWRKDSTGAWKCVVDIWNHNPTERVFAAEGLESELNQSGGR